jgi:phenylpropionate dioxygenase-like ring-hydroxylating dioxygenase large terminal subunit
MNLDALIEPDRVHKSVYTDQQIFDQEMEKIWERTWVYCGHESQVPKPGDYYAVTIGRQPMIMVRQKDGSVQVLYNRCPHRGVQLVGNLKGNTGSAFVCSYHAWSFHLDGKVRAIPLAAGLRRHAADARQPRLQHEARGARRQLPRLRVRQPGRRRREPARFPG